MVGNYDIASELLDYFGFDTRNCFIHMFILFCDPVCKLDLTFVVLAVRFQSNTVGIVIIAHVL